MEAPGEEDRDGFGCRIKRRFVDVWRLLTFSWLTPVLVAGQKEQIDLDALPERSPSDSTRYWADAFNDALDRYEGCRLPVLRAYLRVFWPYVLLFQLISTAQSYVGLLLPFLTKDILALAQAQTQGTPTDAQVTAGCRAVALTVGYQVAMIFVNAHVNFFSTRVGIRFQAATTGAVLRRAVQLREDPDFSVYNIISFDLPACVSVIGIVLQMLRFPLQVTAAIYILYRHIHWAFVPAFAVAISIRSLDLLLNGLDGCLRERLLRRKDVRMGACREAITNIRGIQMHGWEELLAARIGEARDKELRIQAWKLFAEKTCTGLNYVYMYVVTFAALTTYAVQSDAEIDAKTIVPVMAWLGGAVGPFAQVPTWCNGMLVFFSAHRRVMRFLTAHRREESVNNLVGVCSDEQQQQQQQQQQQPQQQQQLAMQLPLLSPTASHSQGWVQMRGLSVLVGPTMSGKSRMLSTALGQGVDLGSTAMLEAPTSRLAYAPQSPAVFMGTVMSNIMLGTPAEGTEFPDVLDACCLTQDIARMPRREQTVVAAEGASLSVGQRRRLSLARAVLHARRRCGAALLDDPFASLDPETRRRIVHGLLGPAGLLREMPVVVATQDPAFLGELPAETNVQVVCLEGCRVVQKRSGRVGSLGLGVDVGSAPPLPWQATPGAPPGQADATPLPEELADAPSVLEEEDRVSGHVRFDIYKRYGAAAGWATVATIVVVCVGINMTQQAVDIWVAYWTSQDKAKADHTLFGIEVAARSTADFVSVYSRLLVLFLLANFSGFWAEVLGGVRASRRLFHEAVRGALHKPLRWWDSAGAGFLENRLTNDVNIMDSAITSLLGIFTGAMVFFFGHVVLLALMTPWVLPIALTVPVAYERLLVRYYRTQNRELQRLVLSTNSPVFASATEAVQHRAVLRCHGESWAYDTAMERLDGHQKAAYCQAALAAWLQLRFALIGEAMTAFSTSNPILQYYGIIDKQSAAWVALGMTYTNGLAGILQQLATNVVGIEQALVSIERLHSLGEDNVVFTPPPGQAPGMSEAALAPVPHCGSVEFDHVTLRYMQAPWPAAVQDVSFFLPDGARAAVVGRTGSGKSTLVAALLRLLAPCEGQIRLGAMPLDTISLKALRQRVIAVVPQVPVVFSGDLMANVDPTLQRLAEAADALRAVGLEPDQELEAASAGQQALVAVARVLAQPEKLVVIADEATACLSPQEAALVARALATLDTTLLVVTHQPEVSRLLRCSETLSVAEGCVTREAVA